MSDPGTVDGGTCALRMVKQVKLRKDHHAAGGTSHVVIEEHGDEITGTLKGVG